MKRSYFMIKSIFLAGILFFFVGNTFAQEKYRSKKGTASLSPKEAIVVDRGKSTELPVGIENNASVNRNTLPSTTDRIDNMETQKAQNPSVETDEFINELKTLKKTYISECEKRGITSLNEEEKMRYAKYKREI